MNKSEMKGGVESPPFFLETKNLNFSRNNEIILEDISFSGYFSGICLIKGMVGTGKTTLLKLIADIFKPDSGTVSLKYRDIESTKYFVHANPEFNFVMGNIRDEIKIAGLRPDIFESYNNMDIDELSGGQLKKLSVLIAVESSKDVVIIDEPFEMLDDNEMMNVYETIVEKSGEKGFIIATHENILDDISEVIINL
ncbi:MAG: ATP-binding cassette domain-containing protein [Flexistipes sinusarabici]|uniref:ATP-binding cassette domain-containing protein n=1 Tax=Flexistipes sinusarabici TaxID=2352 RepID=A0A5D0ML23_FLESI|nr:ATP-binding cassette domain-containing protein [Flexistipes sinusarabici]TYB32293.1 MAG: ATP-binding cassette domain-containing protein [Flexistipes sinusarabici]